MRSSAARSRWAGPAPPRAGLSRDTQREATRALSLSVQSRRHRGDGQAARTPALGTHSPAPLLGRRISSSASPLPVEAAGPGGFVCVRSSLLALGSPGSP